MPAETMTQPRCTVTQWEYHWLRSSTGNKKAEAQIAEDLPAMGAQGWEAVAIDRYSTAYYILLKRPIHDA